MVEETFYIPDLKDNNNIYKLTLAVARAFFELHVVKSEKPKKVIEYKGWMYRSSASKLGINFALNRNGVSGLRLIKVGLLGNAMLKEIFVPIGKKKKMKRIEVKQIEKIENF
ncbi:hypothetical protein PT285_07710 [Lactobacillus sp. ESL0791]|uniref:hypothetical protein n=1 Tax=Lactobacillus sp. ESL0791 TaxID=2983234 RepID=UPI0023F90E7F|nr:hypothetical protein [Lactobacillus sp. ESL0791]MDF7639285.1 hypothetical protein [Lactobacillus sp. ESL0791]